MAVAYGGNTLDLLGKFFNCWLQVEVEQVVQLDGVLSVEEQNNSTMTPPRTFFTRIDSAGMSIPMQLMLMKSVRTTRSRKVAALRGYWSDEVETLLQFGVRWCGIQSTVVGGRLLVVYVFLRLAGCALILALCCLVFASFLSCA